MSDYIKREDAVQSIVEHDITKDESSKEWAIWLLENAKPADVEPVRHGRWEDIEQHSWSVNLACRCQICGWLVNLTQSKAFTYCPNCGARMDGEEE